MSELKVYWNLGSQPGKAVKAFLLTKNIPHEDHHVDMGKMEHKSEEILKLNPMGQIPFITVDGKPFRESTAILRYFADRYPELHEFYPNFSLEERMKIDQVLEWNTSFFRPNLYKRMFVITFFFFL